jgi:hypothetical protein
LIFGILAVCLAYRWIDQLAAENARIDATPSGSKAESAAAE